MTHMTQNAIEPIAMLMIINKMTNMIFFQCTSWRKDLMYIMK